MTAGRSHRRCRTLALGEESLDLGPAEPAVPAQRADGGEFPRLGPAADRLGVNLEEACHLGRGEQSLSCAGAAAPGRWTWSFGGNDGSGCTARGFGATSGPLFVTSGPLFVTSGRAGPGRRSLDRDARATTKAPTTATAASPKMATATSLPPTPDTAITLALYVPAWRGSSGGRARTTPMQRIPPGGVAG